MQWTWLALHASILLVATTASAIVDDPACASFECVIKTTDVREPNERDDRQPTARRAPDSRRRGQAKRCRGGGALQRAADRVGPFGRPHPPRLNSRGGCLNDRTQGSCVLKDNESLLRVCLHEYTNDIHSNETIVTTIILSVELVRRVLRHERQHNIMRALHHARHQGALRSCRQLTSWATHPRSGV